MANDLWYFRFELTDVHLMNRLLTDDERGRMFSAIMYVAEYGTDPEPAPVWASDCAPDLYASIRSKAIGTYKKVHKDPVKQESGKTGGIQRAENERIRQENAASSEPPAWSCKSKKDFESAVFMFIDEAEEHVPRSKVGDLYKELLKNNWRVGSAPITCAEDCVSLLDGERDDDYAENYSDCVPNRTQIIRYLFASCNGFREHEGGICNAEYVVNPFIEYLGYNPSTYHGIEIPEWETKLDGFAETRKMDDGYYDSSF